MTAAAVLSSLACGQPPPTAEGASPRSTAGASESAVGNSGAAAPGFRFVDTAAAAGLTRVLLAGRPGKDHLLDSAGAGAAWLDFDDDGRLDAYLANGLRLDGETVVEKGRPALYRNRGDGTFEDVTDAAGVAGRGEWGGGVAVADVDGDGRDDLLVTHFGSNILYRNRGDGGFEDITGQAGVAAPGWNTGAAFLDADGDGDLDLYVAAYIDQDMADVLAARPVLDWKGMAKVAVGPFGLEGAPDHYFRNEGGGRFVEATGGSGLEDRGLGYGFTVRAADFDLDGDVDIYVANDSDPNYLYRNDGSGRFQEVGVWSGAALDANGAAQAGMGVAVGDADGDGLPDIFVTNFAEDFSTLYLGEGNGFFRDATVASGLGEPTYGPLSWGAVLADLDNDGDQDMVVVNGHIYPQVDDHPEQGMTYAQRNQLLENDGQGRFRDVTDRAGPGFAQVRSSRGLAAGDFDNDGDLDLLITHLDEPPSLLRNDTEGGAWLQVALRPGPGATAVGARVTVSAAGRTMVRDRASSDSFLSAHDPRLHFGLGEARQADRVEVVWPDGRRTVRRGVACCRLLELSPEEVS